MSRHGLPLALALFVLASGCQHPWRNSEDYSRTIGGLEQPNSLIDSRRVATANYGGTGVRQAAAGQADTAQPVVLVSDEGSTDSASVIPITAMLERASRSLVAATEATGDQRDALMATARKGYQEVLSREPDNEAAHHRLGVIGDLQGDFLFAEEHYRAALAKMPADPDLLSDIGYSYQLQDRSDVAEKFFRRALTHDPSHANAANNLGRLLAGRGEHDAAYKLFEVAGGNTHADNVMNQLFPQGEPSEQMVAREEAVSPSPASVQPEIPIVRPLARPENSEPVSETEQRLLIAQQELERQLEDFSPDAFDQQHIASVDNSPLPEDVTAQEAYPPAAADEISQSMADSLLPSLPPDSELVPQEVARPADSGQIPEYPSGVQRRGIPWRQLRVAQSYELQSPPPATASPAPGATPTVGGPSLQATPQPQPSLSPTSPLPYVPDATPRNRAEELLNAQPVSLAPAQPTPSVQSIATPLDAPARYPSRAPQEIKQYPFNGVVNEPLNPRAKGVPASRVPQVIATPPPERMQVVQPVPRSELRSLEAASPRVTPQAIEPWPGLQHSSPAPKQPADYPNAKRPTLEPPAELPAYRPLNRPVYEPLKQTVKQQITRELPATARPVANPTSGPSGFLPIIRPKDD